MAGVFPEELLAPPVVGFDRAILTLEARFADAPVVLVHGGLLAGKSRLAAEYARWLSSTSPEPRPVTYLRLWMTAAISRSRRSASRTTWAAVCLFSTRPTTPGERPRNW
jgi:hypothetical protein